MSDTKYRMHKLVRRKTGYPVASVAYYGPDDTFASKVVVGITLSERDSVLFGQTATVGPGKSWITGKRPGNLTRSE